jgi:3',5'-cyclic AMP phosphodiesterase CpdA
LFTLAHLSDPHLGPLPSGAARRHFALKRTIGVINWRLSRHRIHDPAVVAAITADIKDHAPDHVALTGDLVNVAAHSEFPNAATWLEAFGAPDWISVVPGNHDTYVRCDWQHGLRHFAPYMTGEMRVPEPLLSAQIATPFPYVRLRRNIALIGVSSAIPQPIHRAAGLVGAVQLAALASLLRELRERGFARVVMIHHPPLPGLAIQSRALGDAGPLAAILAEQGAELVLHGHNHEPMRHQLASRFGTVHVLGVPSASSGQSVHHAPAAWNFMRIARQGGRWLTSVAVRRFDPTSHHMSTAEEFTLSP